MDDLQFVDLASDHFMAGPKCELAKYPVLVADGSVRHAPTREPRGKPYDFPLRPDRRLLGAVYSPPFRTSKSNVRKGEEIIAELLEGRSERAVRAHGRSHRRTGGPGRVWVH